ncbi:F-box only protein 48 isoform X2 [Poeciliopsis prolifica]|uniref:F-box only protein 48 isoform X2 n=1 Tax=Poeciliopsis prolifica TaxID=188132 RepID=UPI00241430F9|nr:F-box only protein 48 isoform X2 [Poeciliopsis prolifica]
MKPSLLPREASCFWRKIFLAPLDLSSGSGSGSAPGSAPLQLLFLLCERRAGLTSLEPCGSQNFAETLPTEMSVRIFRELDAESLCRASRTCKLWRSIIDDNEQLWRQQCMLVRAVCRREVDSDRSDGLSWKVTLLRNYSRSRVKAAWLAGRYSGVRSADELLGSKMAPLDAETWGEILQAELDR